MNVPAASDALERLTLLILIPYLNEVKLSWVYAAVPLYFLANDWPLMGFGLIATAWGVLRMPMNTLITCYGDWLIAPFLLVASFAAALMLANPDSYWAVAFGVLLGGCVDTSQTQASLCYRWSGIDAGRRQRGLRLIAFGATFGYSTGALLGGALYEVGGFKACAVLELLLTCTLSVLAHGLPGVRASFRERLHTQHESRSRAAARQVAPDSGPAAAAASCTASLDGEKEDAPLTLRSTTTGCLLLPASLVILCDGLNVGAYVCEWTLFAVYFHEVYDWSSTLTGAAQMAGDLLAAAVLAVTTTAAWTRLLGKQTAPGRATRRLDRLLLQPPFNLGIYFGLYGVFFLMLAQSTFAVAVTGQVLMGSVYVFLRQAVQESYVVLSHGSLPLFRTLEFLGGLSFNTGIAVTSSLSVMLYERLGRSAPFYIYSGVTAAWSAVTLGFFLHRHRGHLHLSFAEQEARLYARKHGVRGAAAPQTVATALSTGTVEHAVVDRPHPGRDGSGDRDTTR